MSVNRATFLVLSIPATVFAAPSACSCSLKNRSQLYFQPASFAALKALTGAQEVTSGVFWLSATWAMGTMIGGVHAPSRAVAPSLRISSRAWALAVLGSLRLSRTFSWTVRLVPPTSSPPPALASSTACW